MSVDLRWMFFRCLFCFRFYDDCLKVTSTREKEGVGGACLTHCVKTDSVIIFVYAILGQPSYEMIS